MRKIYFFNHNYMRDRQLDTIRNWPEDEVVNPEIAKDRQGSQVSKMQTRAPQTVISWKQKLPLINIKKRPANLSQETIVYVWGAVLFNGKFIVELDNPWSLVGYNVRAMTMYKSILRRILLSKRCVEIRCISKACRESVLALFGPTVYEKTVVDYPVLQLKTPHILPSSHVDKCRFLFVGTQFEIKGGDALVRSFTKLYQKNSSCSLDIVTHLPERLGKQVDSCPGINVHDAVFTREEIHERFMKQADVFVLPTYGESIGMVVPEALSHGMAIITTDVYALGEFVKNGINGNLITPPISIWDGVLPSRHMYDWQNFKNYVSQVETEVFEHELEKAMERFVLERDWLLNARQASISLMREHFI